MKTLLLTGFEPFYPHDKNMSWEAIKDLKKIGGYSVVSCCLPVCKFCVMDLGNTIKQVNPQVIISFGVHPRLKRKIQFETMSKSYRGLGIRIAPFKRIAQRLKDKKVKVIISKDAGKWICDYLWGYLISEHLNRNVFFVHIPNESSIKPKVKKTIETILEEVENG